MIFLVCACEVTCRQWHTISPASTEGGGQTCWHINNVDWVVLNWWQRSVSNSQPEPGCQLPPHSQQLLILITAFNHSANSNAEAEYDRLRSLAREEATKRSSCFNQVFSPNLLAMPLVTSLMSQTGTSVPNIAERYFLTRMSHLSLPLIYAWSKFHLRCFQRPQISFCCRHNWPAYQNRRTTAAMGKRPMNFPKRAKIMQQKWTRTTNKPLITSSEKTTLLDTVQMTQSTYTVSMWKKQRGSSSRGSDMRSKLDRRKSVGHPKFPN